jgi:hypothetical protein
MTRYITVWQLRSCCLALRPLWREDGFPCQRSLSRVRVPWDSRPYFTVSDVWLPFSSPSTTHRVTVEVFGHASYNRSSLYRLRTDHTESTIHVTSLCLRKLHKHKENTATVLLYDVTAYAEVRLPRRCLKTGCISPLFYFCVRVLLINDSFCCSTVLVWSKYITICFVWLS